MKPHQLKVKTEIKLSSPAFLDDETTEMESNMNKNDRAGDDDDEVLIINGESSSGRRFSRRNESHNSLQTADYLKSR